MTRLCTADVQDITIQLAEYDRQLQRVTGNTLLQIAARAAGTDALKVLARDSFKIAIVPITNGQGIIEGFSDSIRGIANHLGFQAFVTAEMDVAGIAEAFLSAADLIMLADDYRFIAINTATKKVVDNSEATAKGYVAALELMAGSLVDAEVLVLGAGPVGRSAIRALATVGAKVVVYDIEERISQDVAREFFQKYGIDVKVEIDLDEALCSHQILFDACPAGAFIKRHHLGLDSMVAAPGIPLGLETECLPLISGKLLHDPLQIGAATMIIEALYGKQV